MMRRAGWVLAAAAPALLAITGCGHRAKVAYAPPPPPISGARNYPENHPSARHLEPYPPQRAEVGRHGKPISSEVGIASWYGPPYNNHRGANGRIYNQNAITAANLTLPMGSLIRVTDLKTGQSAMMRITDRGPFVPGRILDLSVGAAKKIGMYRAGIARVRMDVYETPKPMYGGRWCVQIGAFHHSGAAKKLKKHLARQYESASVIEFKGPTGYWVRIRPENGNHRRAFKIAHALRPKEGEAYLVRLD
ncbi:MAG TPA: septal ring lytic transglycosylase RlpA family protein [Acidobacteriaceae bacterium]|nr:septal ring lytic transglycosylase RlpA family protein [Acidobacteriaceae bacterium]